MKLSIIYLSIISFVVFSCTEIPNDSAYSNALGTWKLKSIDNDTYIMQKSNTLPEDSYGFTLTSNKKIIERKNIGWCGTPPEVYGSYEGTWESVEDNLLRIKVAYWGGIESYDMRITYVDLYTLKFIKVYNN